jgi:uncharacterized metal-binding protein YceD (DUF177 family)
MQKTDNKKVGAEINLIKLPVNTCYEFEFDKETDWVKSILLELNENATEKSPQAYLEETSLVITGDIEKKSKSEMGEILLVDLHIEAQYATECVRTLKPMIMELSTSVKICFVDESLASSEMFAEAEETWVENETYELYFYDKRTIKFQEMIHEQIFLNYDQYPILDADSKLEGVESMDPAKS